MQKYQPQPKDTTSGHVIDLATTLQYGLGTGNSNFLDFLIQHTEMVHDPPYSDWTCMMTCGNTFSLDACLQMLFNHGDTLLMEEFTFTSAIETVVPHQIHPVAMSMDDDGVNAEALEDMLTNWKSDLPKPKVMYIIPTGQNPTGSSMPPERRKAIYAIAQRHNIIILEDEPYYFLQMPKYSASVAQTNGHDLDPKSLIAALTPSFLRLDVDGRVLRFDSFSKTIAPGTRCGYITGCLQLIERLTRHNEVTIQAPAGFSQIILYNMLALNWGHDGFLQWLMHIRHVYTARRDACMQAMDEHMPKRVARWVPPVAGMFFWVELDATLHPEFNGDIVAIEQKVYAHALEAGILVIPGSWFMAERGRTPKSLFFRGTFAAGEPKACQEGIRRFGHMLRAEFRLP